MNKELIKERFAKNIKTYNENAVVQKNMAKKLVGMLPLRDFGNILEIGCGTGFLTEIISKEVNYKNYLANDIVEGCGDYVKKISSEIEFLSGDIENLVKNSSGRYDLIISNAVFQWVEDFESFYKILLSKLAPKGILLFSTFGKNNFQEISETLGISLNYFSKNDYENMFNGVNYLMEEETQFLEFETPLEVLKHIKSTGVNCLNSTFWTKTKLEEFEVQYPQPFKLTYNPLYIMVSK